MPSTADRDPVELLLCDHHYRASRQALHAAGAVIFDATASLDASPSQVAYSEWLLRKLTT